MKNTDVYPASLLPYLLLLPQLLISLVFFYWPGFEALRQAFYSTSFWGTYSRYVGLENFFNLFHDNQYISSLFTTVGFSTAVTLLTMSCGLLFATLVNRVLRQRRTYKTLLIWPYAVAPAIAGVLWGFLFNPAVGIITYIFHHLGFSWNYFTVGWQAFWLTVFAAVWQQVSYNFLFFLTGLAAIPQSVLEAASIDGAGPMRRFWTITFPLLSPTVFFLLVMNLVYTFFDTFGIISTLTQGGPANSTNILVYKVYSDGFIGQQMGSSATQSVILMLIVIALSVFQFRYIEGKVHY